MTEQVGKVRDLPEPSRKTLSPEERVHRQWRLLVVFTHFVTFYACIHKLFIPLGLKVTSLNQTPYAHIQFSVLIPLILSFSMFYSSKSTKWISFLCGVGIVFGIDELYQVLVSRHQGWFAFSRLLSSIPFALACGFAMSRKAFGRDLLEGWKGALIFLGIIFIREWQISKVDANLLLNSHNSSANATESFQNLDCGAMELTVHSSSRVSVETSASIENCGLQPSILKGQKLTLKNNRSEAINLHLLYFTAGQKKIGWNLLVPPLQSIQSPKVQLEKETVGLLYSDSHPSMGIIALVPENLEGEWYFSRKPISVLKKKEQAP